MCSKMTQVEQLLWNIQLMQTHLIQFTYHHIECHNHIEIRMVKSELKEMIDSGIIELSASQWSLLRKKMGLLEYTWTIVD